MLVIVFWEFTTTGVFETAAHKAFVERSVLASRLKFVAEAGQEITTSFPKTCAFKLGAGAPCTRQRSLERN